MSMESYDRDSGLVFLETIVEQSRQSLPWDLQCADPKSAPVRRPQGARRLFEIASAQLFRRLDGLTAELLSELPTAVVELLWSEIERHGYHSFRVWKAFASSKNCDKSSCFEHRQQLWSLSTPLVDFFAEITSFNCDWMTNLALLDVSPFSRADLKCLHTLTNLQGLYLRSGHCRECFLDDDLLSYLAHCSKTNRAFQHLRILFIEQALQVTKNAFSSLYKFPALKVVCLLRTGVRKERVKKMELFGWTLKPCLASSSVDPTTSRSVQRAFELYCEREREGLPDDRKGAVLNIIMGSYGPFREIFDQTTNMLCFERSQANTSMVPTNDSHTDRNNAAIPTRILKRRKMKEGRTLDLEVMLDSL